ncbi:MAG: DNA mismatch repair endonuclease MutL [Coraliomargaritaceae bacterium]
MSNLPTISLLEDQVINKIAAGEVVERPASVVKELFENAIDAKSDRIEVSVERGGARRLIITDNGHGMNRNQALLSLERHATSKIQSEADIEQITTLGFRGEALAAIASVSHFSLTTRTADQLEGTLIRVEGGKIVTCAEVGCPIGTQIEINDLFYNVPARRKFLRAEQTELSHIRQTILVHALAHPTVGISLVADGRTLYQLHAAGTLADRVSALYQPAFLHQLCPIQFHQDDIQLDGFTGLPQTGRKDRTDQFIFVNGRPASAPIVYHAVNEVYHPLIGRGRFPALFLFITLPPETVDVNVHPTKKEVRFRHPQPLRDIIIHALKKALGRSPEVPEIDSNKPALPPIALPPQREKQQQWEPLLMRPELTVAPMTKDPHASTAAPFKKPSPSDESSPAPTPPLAEAPWGWCRTVGQLGGHYIVLETRDGYALMEPRAAHERVLYEKCMTAFESGSVTQQKLLTPEAIELTPTDAERVRQAIPLLNKLGFSIDAFGSDTFLIDALPVWVQHQPIEPLLYETARALAEGGRSKATREGLADIVMQTACAGAVRASDSLTNEAIEKLIADLAKTEMPYTSPRGRPTLIFTSYSELERSFHKNSSV